jgi:hypothetical protein
MNRSYLRWYVLVPVAALLFAGVASVAFSLGAASGGPGAQAAQPTTIPGHPELGPGWYAPSTLRGGAGQVAIAITKIEGTKLSLQTTDGWTRTIDATGATIMKGGKTIALTDLKLGDQINFRESRQSDGSYKITTIQVLVPTASGTVSSVGSDTVTIKQFDGSSRTLTLTGSTTYTQGGAAATKSALVAGVRISAQGTLDAAGNFTATAVTIAPSAVLGTVASKTPTTIVVTTTAGKTVTVNISPSTKYSVRGVASPTLADVAVGYRIQAQGALNADGSLTATVVQAAPNDQPGFGGGFGQGGGFGRGGFGGRHGPFPLPSGSPSAPSI